MGESTIQTATPRATVGEAIFYWACAIFNAPLVIAFMAVPGFGAMDWAIEAVDSRFMQFFVGGVALISLVLFVVAWLIGPFAFVYSKTKHLL